MSLQDEVRRLNFRLDGLMEELSEKEIVRALRNTYRKEARKIKRVAEREIKKSGWHNAAKIAKTVRAKARKDMQGYIVAANPHGKPSMHLNRRGLLKPIAFWMDQGTDNNGDRKIKGRGHYGKNRGSTAGLHFTEKAAKEVPASLKRLQNEFVDQVAKIIERKMK